MTHINYFKGFIVALVFALVFVPQTLAGGIFLWDFLFNRPVYEAKKIITSVKPVFKDKTRELEMLEDRLDFEQEKLAQFKLDEHVKINHPDFFDKMSDYLNENAQIHTVLNNCIAHHPREKEKCHTIKKLYSSVLQKHQDIIALKKMIAQIEKENKKISQSLLKKLITITTFKEQKNVCREWYKSLIAQDEILKKLNTSLLPVEDELHFVQIDSLVTELKKIEQERRDIDSNYTREKTNAPKKCHASRLTKRDNVCFACAAGKPCEKRAVRVQFYKDLEDAYKKRHQDLDKKFDQLFSDLGKNLSQ